ESAGRLLPEPRRESAGPAQVDRPPGGVRHRGRLPAAARPHAGRLRAAEEAGGHLMATRKPASKSPGAPKAKVRRAAPAPRGNGNGNGRAPQAGSNSDFERYCRETFGPAATYAKPEVLKGVRVLSATQYILGPSCAAYLGELGAEVIKIEAPRRGEPMRHSTPGNEGFLYPLSRWVPQSGTGLGFFGANFNEPFISMDFHRPEARELIYKLAAECDLMVERLRPGGFGRWGIGYRQLREVNPRLIYVWCGGFGGWGPGRVRASYDILGQAQGGAFAITGQPEELGGSPAKHTIWLADYWGGRMAATHRLPGLYWGEHGSGQGTFIELSQVHGVPPQLEAP